MVYYSSTARINVLDCKGMSVGDVADYLHGVVVSTLGSFMNEHFAFAIDDPFNSRRFDERQCSRLIHEAL